MELSWHIRLVDRMIKTNPDKTIKDYMSIVDHVNNPEVPERLEGNMFQYLNGKIKAYDNQ